jgi:hypothetical protein
MAKKQKQPRSHPQPDDSAPNDDGATDLELTGIAKAAEELSLAVKEFDRMASTWSSKPTRGDLVRT